MLRVKFAYESIAGILILVELNVPIINLLIRLFETYIRGSSVKNVRNSKKKNQNVSFYLKSSRISLKLKISNRILHKP